LTPSDIDRDLIAAAQVTYLEGYLFDRDQAKDAFRQAGKFEHDAGRKVSLTLSDPFCVDRHRADFRNLIKNHVDILFANESEICSLYETKNFDEAANAVKSEAEIAVLTRSEKGAIVVSAKDRVAVPAAPVAKVVDTTGAGDLFASGFLYGFTRGKDFAHCAKLGALCAAEIISHFGARPEVKLKELAAKAGLA
jgi:sugar/nucleoside kinase (ribokinase family)